MKARIIVDGVEEAKVEGSDKQVVLSQACLYFCQYAEDFKNKIVLEITK